MIGSGVQPLASPTLPDASSNERKAWLRKGSPGPANPSHWPAGRSATPRAIRATISASRSAIAFPDKRVRVNFSCLAIASRADRPAVDPSRLALPGGPGPRDDSAIDRQELRRTGPKAAPAVERRCVAGDNEATLHLSGVSRQPFADRRLETHHADRSVVADKIRHDRFSQLRGIATPAFQFDQHWHSTADHLKQVEQPRHMFIGAEQPLPGQHGCRRRFDRQGGGAEALQIMIMKDHDLAVSRQAYVALDPRPRLDRSAERGQAVFRNARSMEPAMREPPRARI